MKYALILCLLFSAFAKDQPSYTMVIGVLKTKQVPFVAQSSNHSSSNCRVTGTSFDTYDIQCDTYQNSTGIKGVSYVMLATSDDGNTYLFGCDAQWRWSHCSGLIAGQKFHARKDRGQIAVEAFDSKGKASEIRYAIFEMSVTQQ